MTPQAEPTWSRIEETATPTDDETFNLDVEEAATFEAEAEALRLEDRRELLKSRRQDRHERKRYAERIFRLVCCWLGAAITLVVLAGGDAVSLSDGLLITLVGSTTASIVAIFAVVAKYLFPTRTE